MRRQELRPFALVFGTSAAGARPPRARSRSLRRPANDAGSHNEPEQIVYEYQSSLLETRACPSIFILLLVLFLLSISILLLLFHFLGLRCFISYSSVAAFHSARSTSERRCRLSYEPASFLVGVDDGRDQTRRSHRFNRHMLDLPAERDACNPLCIPKEHSGGNSRV